jgi:tryptophanyl-tRNA synthetase
VRLQNEGVELLVLVADYQTMTDRTSPESLPGDVEELVADYLAVGIDPTRATIFASSASVGDVRRRTKVSTTPA